MKKALIILMCFVLMYMLAYALDKTVIVDSENLNIVTSFYPIYIATLNVTDGVSGVNVTNLTNNTTGCLHDYTLTTEQMVSLSSCDVFVINGAGMESFIDNVISNYSNLNIIDSSKNLKLLKDKEDDEINSHTFASVSNYIIQVKTIAKQLGKIDSKNEEKYIENADNYILELEQLEKSIKENTVNVDNKNIVTFHESFEYFAEEFGLNVLCVIEEEHGKMPSAKEIADITKKIKENNVKTIFVEPDSSLKLAQAIAKETGAKIYTLNPVTTGDNKKTAYVDIMKENVKVLKEAL